MDRSAKRVQRDRPPDLLEGGSGRGDWDLPFGAYIVSDPLVLTVEQAADELQVSSRTVERLVDDGLIPHVRIRSTVRIPKSALATWLDETAMAALRDQAVTSFIVDRENPTAVEIINRRYEEPPHVRGMGSLRKRRDSGQKRTAVAGNDHSSASE